MKKTLKQLQDEFNPKYIAQPKPDQIKMRIPIALSRSIEILLHPALKRF
jgi:hypothetical protein